MLLYPWGWGMEQQIKEEQAIVLDYLPNGYPFDSRPIHLKTPIVQAIGKNHFVLLELVTRRDTPLQPHDEIYIGEGKRDKIHHINGRLPASKLTPTAKAELEFVIAQTVKRNEQQFVEFFNTARPLSTRMHSIELIPGMGKKRMWEIIEKRKEEPFTSFADMRKRCTLIPDPEKAIIHRIISEINGQEKYYLFAER